MKQKKTLDNFRLHATLIFGFFSSCWFSLFVPERDIHSESSLRISYEWRYQKILRGQQNISEKDFSECNLEIKEKTETALSPVEMTILKVVFTCQSFFSFLCQNQSNN